MKYYNVTYKSRNFYAKVQMIDTNTTEIMLGGSSHKCVTVHVYNDEEYVYLSALLYDSLCVLKGDLERKQGTVDMLNAALLLCKNLFPTKKYIQYSDDSVIRCDNSRILPLPEMYMMLYGKTWYQPFFDVVPMHTPDKVKYVQQVLKDKPSMQWNILWGKFLSLNFSTDMMAVIRNKYLNASSWHEFFKSIKDERCTYWQDWVIPLFNTLSKNHRLRCTLWCMSFPKKGDRTIKSTTRMSEITPKYSWTRFFGGSTTRYMQK